MKFARPERNVAVLERAAYQDFKQHNKHLKYWDGKLPEMKLLAEEAFERARSLRFELAQPGVVLVFGRD